MSLAATRRRWWFPGPEGLSDAAPFSATSWHRTVVVMHTAFVALVGLGAVDVAVRSDEPGRAPWAVAALGALAVAYLVAGAPGLAARRGEVGRDPTESYDVVVALPPGDDPAPYAAAGATWWLVEFPWDEVSVDQVRAVIRDGPAARA